VTVCPASPVDVPEVICMSSVTDEPCGNCQLPGLFTVIDPDHVPIAGVGVVGTTGAAVGTAVDAALGVADADAEAEVDAVVDAACDVLPAAWLLLVDDVQPATDNEAITTSTIIANNFFFIQIPLDGKMNQKRKTGPMKLKCLFSA
jgi:hypothetical protein